MLHPIADSCFVDEKPISEPRQLHHGEIVRLGTSNYFKFNHPTEALRLRKLREATPSSSQSKSSFTPSQSKLRDEVTKKDEELRLLQLKYQREQEEKERTAEEERLQRELMELQLQTEYEKRFSICLHLLFRFPCSTIVLAPCSNFTNFDCYLNCRLNSENERMQRLLEEQAKKHREEMELIRLKAQEDHDRRIAETAQLKEKEVEQRLEARERERLQRLAEESKQQRQIEVEKAVAREREAAEAKLRVTQSKYERDRQLHEESSKSAEVLRQRVAEVKITVFKARCGMFHP